MTPILTLLPIIQATPDPSSFILLPIIIVLFSLIIFLAGVWVRPILEESWPQFVQPRYKRPKIKQASPSPPTYPPVEKPVASPKTEPTPPVLPVPPQPPKPPSAPLEVDHLQFEYRYRQHLINMWEKKEFWVSANQQPLPLHREDFFVRPQFSVESSLKSKLTLTELLRTFQHLVMLGVSGSGKTETIIYLLLTYARQEVQSRLRFDEPLLPILLPAPVVAEALSNNLSLSLPDFLNQQLQPPTDRYVKDRLKSGMFFLLLDGLYEVSSQPARQVITWFEAQINLYPDNRFLAVARPSLREAFNADGPLTISEFNKLEADALRTLTRKWKVLIPDALNILTSITQEEDVYALARNPMRLHMLLLVGLTTRNLPTHRTQLYANYLSVVIAGSMKEDGLIAQFSDTEKQTVLQRLALTLHKSHQILMTEADLKKLVQEALTALGRDADDAERALTERILQSGLMVRKQRQYRFAHLSFQEFLAAQSQEIEKGELHDILDNDIVDPWWQEVKTFYQDLTDSKLVINQAFTQETKDLVDIDQSQAYTLSLLMQNLAGFETQKLGNGLSISKKGRFDFDSPDAHSEPSANGDSDEAVTVMVVDDTPQNIQLARFILQRENYQVLEANNAEEALNVIQGNRPSLILSDIQMPGMDGYEFCRRLKADPTTQNIPFIFVTAFSRSTKEAARGLQIGADDYITRPFAPEELLARIGANVRIHQAEEAARRQATILARRNRELALLNQIQRAVTASLNLDNVLDASMEQVQKVLKAEGTSLWFVDRANRALLLSAAFNDSARTIHGIRQPLHEGIAGHVVNTGYPYLTNNVQNDAHYTPSPTDRGDYVIRSMLCVPLHIRQQVIGVLQAVHHEQNHFNQDDLDLLNAVGDAVTVAIENAWLFGQVQIFNQQLNHKVEARTHELAREKEKTETILISIADSLLVIDTANKLIMSNRAAEELLDFKIPDLIDQSIDQDDRDRFDTPLWSFVRDINAHPDPTYTATTEVVSPTNPDKLLSIQAHAAKMWDNTQRVYTGTVIVLRDVTALQEVDRMKARFMTGITHELKTPLAIMTLHIGSLLKYKTIDEKRRLDMLQTIQKQAHLLERLVENILQLSRLDGGMQIRREPVNLVALTQPIVTELEPLAKKKSLKLLFKPSKKKIMIEADAAQFERVIRNLIDNAVKYTNSGQVTVSISTVEDSPRGQAILSVSDTGIGLNQEQIERLFERFYRADPSHNIPGTGLGLSIAKEIAVKHGGDIRVESEFGQGSTFTVTLPLQN